MFAFDPLQTLEPAKRRDIYDCRNAMMREAALDGFGLVNLPEDYVAPHVSAGRLIRVLEDWCPRYPGYHLYYPSRRQPTPAFSLLVDALGHRTT